MLCLHGALVLQVPEAVHALIKCSSPPMLYLVGPQPRANCTVMLHPYSSKETVLQWVIAPSSSKPEGSSSSMYGSSGKLYEQERAAFTPGNMDEKGEVVERGTCNSVRAKYAAVLLTSIWDS